MLLVCSLVAILFQAEGYMGYWQATRLQIYTNTPHDLHPSKLPLLLYSILITTFPFLFISFSDCLSITTFFLLPIRNILPIYQSTISFYYQFNNQSHLLHFPDYFYLRISSLLHFIKPLGMFHHFWLDFHPRAFQPSYNQSSIFSTNELL